ncbi:MAG: EAL domain-containing protein, partial [Gammaproteobacteria bacterium]|nr:EAL domain-containing protein [Gammaproteobacteria bacterium]
VQAKRVHDLIEGELRRSGIAGMRVDIEVIEQADHGALAGEIASLKRAGYRISLDDFGTGYANLASVRSLAPDHLKIDKSFVYEMEDASLRSSLIPQMVSIARAVGAKVIAEGIENDAQCEKLLAHGVDYGQGFLFAEPMEIKALGAWLHGVTQEG